MAMDFPNSPTNGQTYTYGGRTWTYESSSNSWKVTYVGANAPAIPVGMILMWGGAATAASAPSGYLVCDGSAVSRSTYAALFAVIGTTYGVGNGSTTFNLPAGTGGQVPVGIALTANTRSTTVTSGGESANHTHTISASASTDSSNADHGHSFSATSGNNSAGHDHTYTDYYPNSGASSGSKTTSTAGATHTHTFSGTTGNAASGPHTHTITSANANAGTQSASHTHSLTAVAVTYIIKY